MNPPSRNRSECGPSGPDPESIADVLVPSRGDTPIGPEARPRATGDPGAVSRPVGNPAVADTLNPGLIADVLEGQPNALNEDRRFADRLRMAAEAYPRLDPAERRAQLAELRRLIDAQDRLVGQAVPPLPQPGDDYPKYSGGDPLKWLGEHWGTWLQHFSSHLPHSYLYLDQLGRLDPPLKDALYARRRAIRTHTGLKVSEIVPSKSERLKQEAEDAGQSRLKKAVSLYAWRRHHSSGSEE